MSHFYAYLSRMKHIMRWGLMRNTQPENIQEHSQQVAMIAHGLAVISNTYFGGHIDEARVTLLAVYHEASEVITGDMATPVKYFSDEIKSEYKKLEQMACVRLIEMLPPELRERYRPLLIQEPADVQLWQLVKAADKLCAYLKCVEELKMGNHEFSKACQSIQHDLHRMEMKEVEHFLSYYAPGFSLTLDELN